MDGNVLGGLQDNGYTATEKLLLLLRNLGRSKRTGLDVEGKNNRPRGWKDGIASRLTIFGVFYLFLIWVAVCFFYFLIPIKSSFVIVGWMWCCKIWEGFYLFICLALPLLSVSIGLDMESSCGYLAVPVSRYL